MLRGAERWLAGYLRSRARRERPPAGVPRHILLCVADHFEPFDRTILPDGRVTGGVDKREALALVRQWCRNFRDNLAEFHDADGYTPRQTFFYAWDEYDADVLDELAGFCRAGFGEVEVHLHHRNDSAAGLQEKLEECREVYAGRHGLLGRLTGDLSGTANATAGSDRVVYGFVHGNWCLCNARKDGDWCGVDRELEILARTGCYADFSFPSAPSETQPKFVNKIVYGRDPRGGERGVQQGAPVVRRVPDVGGGDVGSEEDPADVMLIPGPLGLNWRSRKFGVLPRLENGELSGVNPPTMERLNLWNSIGVHVPGRPEWVVVKLHTHGARPANMAVVTGDAMADFYRGLEKWGRDEKVCLHFVTARELFNIIKAAEAGMDGSPGEYRDWKIGRAG